MRTMRHGFGNEAKVSITMNLIFAGKLDGVDCMTFEFVLPFVAGKLKNSQCIERLSVVIEDSLYAFCELVERSGFLYDSHHVAGL